MNNKEPKSPIRHTLVYPEPKQMAEIGKKLKPNDKLIIPSKNQKHARKHLKWAVRVANHFGITPGLQNHKLNYDLKGARLTISR